MKKYLLILSLFFILQTAAYSQESSAYEGTRFLVSFMQNENYIQTNTGLLLQLFITSKYETLVTVNQPYHPSQQYLLKQDSVLTVYIDEKLEMYRSEVPLDNAVEVLSDLPVTITAYSSQWKTTDSYAAIPVEKWGTRYVVLSQPNDQYHPPPDIPPLDSARLAYPRSSEFLVIANEDTTVITFRPRALTERAKQIFRHYSVTLNKGECYLVKSFPTQKGTGDLTGTVVTGNKPFGFLSGHVRTAIPQFLIPLWDSKNHLVEMLQPVKSWGRKFATIKMLPYQFVPHGDMIRVTCFYPNTRVSIKTATGYQSLFLKDSGDYVSLPYFDAPAYWVADKPVQIGQYMMHSGRSQDSYSFDPALVTIPSIEQFIQKVVFQTPGNPTVNPDQFRYHFVSMIASKPALNSLVYDSKLITSFTPIMTQKIPGTELHYARFTVSSGRHKITCQNGGFAAILLGVGDADAYAHIIGSSITNPYLKDTIPPEIAFNYECGKVEGYAFEEFLKPWIDTINTGIDYVQVIEDSTYNFTWMITPINDTTTYIDIKAEVIDIRKDGMFIVDIRDRNGNGGRYRFPYYKLQVNTPTELNFGNVDVKDSVCKHFNIINEGSDTLLIKSSYLSDNDLRFLYALDRNLPCYLPPGDTIHGTICFEPNGDTTTPANQLVLIYDCDLVSRIPVNANVLNYELWPEGYDFGIVRVGDTTCADVYLINSGNTDIVIDSVEFASTHKAYYLDSAGVFPATVKPGDTLFLRVCFTPDSVTSYAADIYWRNSKVSNIKSTVTGTGGAPHFDSLLIDWGRRRVGTKNDTLIIIKNTGNLHGIIKYNSTLSDNDNFDKIDLFAINYAIDPGDSVVINSSFFPDSTIDYDLQIEYECDWERHVPVVYELKGTGTIPEIKTVDIDFGIVDVFSSNDTVATVVESAGNEDLKIIKAFVENGDTDDFKIDLTQFDNITVPAGSQFNVLINFTPQSIAFHQAVIGVISDAAPNYGRDTAYFRLLGTAIELDTIRALEQITGPDEILSCQDYIYTYSIQNTGNTDFEITALDLHGINLNAEWVSNPDIPFILAEDSTKSFDISVTADASGKGLVAVNSVINDSIRNRTEKQITIIQNKIILGNFPGFKTTPGDSLEWEINGTFPNMTNQHIDLQLILKLNMQDYLLTAKKLKIILTGDKFSENIDCTVLQTINEVKITPLRPINLPEDDIKWKIVLPFYVFLSEHRFPKIEIYISSNNCFDKNDKQVNTEIGEVCVLNMRAVVIDKSKFNVQIHPNPASDKLNCNIEMFEDSDVFIEIFDSMGKKSYYSEKIFLKKGNNSRIFEISSLTNGVYVLKISSHAFSKNIIFIIIK